MALKTCCCGCTVKTGALIVGYLQAVASGIGIFICILAMIVDGSITKYEPEMEDHQPRPMPVVMDVQQVLMKIYLMVTVLCLKSLLVNCLMIHGINRTKPAYVLPWIIFFGAGMVIKSLLAVFAIAFSANIPIAVWCVIVSASTLCFLFEAYVLVVVSSHYHRMKKSSLLDEEQIMM